jgi:hypothetical protein
MTETTRRRVLELAAAAGATALVGTAAAKPDDKLNPGEPFGRVYANGDLWRTNVVRKSDEQFDPDDALFFVHGGDPAAGGDGPLQPAVSESAPGDRDWNGGRWTHYGTEVVDRQTYEAEYRPITSESELRAAEDAGVVKVTKGRPFAGAPPNFFLCPLTGRV